LSKTVYVKDNGPVKDIRNYTKGKEQNIFSLLQKKIKNCTKGKEQHIFSVQ